MICEFRICIWVIHKLDLKQENYWSCIAHLSDEDMLKSAVIEEKKFKHKFQWNLFEVWFYTIVFMI